MARPASGSFRPPTTTAHSRSTPSSASWSASRSRSSREPRRRSASPASESAQRATHDLASCNELCARVHGHDRGGELRDAIAAGTAHVVERPEGICGYATGFGYGWHAVAETNEHLIALIGSAQAFMGLGILVPTRNSRASPVVPGPRPQARPTINADDHRPVQRTVREPGCPRLPTESPRGPRLRCPHAFRASSPLVTSPDMIVVERKPGS